MADSPAALAEALAAWSAAPAPAAAAAVYAALADATLLLAVRASVVAESVALATGLPADKEAELAILTVTLADGRTVLPAFSSADLMRRWRLEARPVRSSTPDTCRAVLDEGWAGVVLDPGTADFTVGLPEVRALVEGFVPVAGAASVSVGSLSAPDLLPRAPVVVSRELMAELRRALAREPVVAAGWLLRGPPDVVIGLALRTPLDPAGLATIGGRLAGRLAGPAGVAQALAVAALDDRTAEQAELRCVRLWP